MKISKNWVVVLLLIVYIVLVGTTTQALHFSWALDEEYHLEYINFLKQHHRLPVSYQERATIARADYPPFYHILVTILSNGVDIEDGPYFKYFSDSERYRAIDHQLSDPLVFYNEDFRPPYIGQFLVWQIGRAFSGFLSLLTALVVFFTLQEIPIGRKPLTSFFGMALLVFIPRFLIVSSSLNDDNLLGLVAAVYFFLLVKSINSPENWLYFILLGVILGISVTVKYTMVLLPVEIIVVCLALANNYKFGWWWAIKRILVVGVLAVIFSSWWFGWNIWHLNTIANDGILTGITKPLFSGGYDPTLNQLNQIFEGNSQTNETTSLSSNGTYLRWLQLTFITFWSFPVEGSIPLAPFAFAIIGVVLLVAVLGLWKLWRSNRNSRGWIILFLIHIAILIILPLFRFALTMRLGYAAQGRYILFPAATAIVALIVWGLVTAISYRWHQPTFALFVVGLIGWSGLHTYQLWVNPKPYLPLRTNAQTAELLPRNVNARFGDSIELVSYDIDPQPARGQLNLHLAWRSLDTVNESYLLNITLLDKENEPASQWVGYNGNGRLPTLAWDPGDVVFDRLSLPLPDVAAGDYRVEVKLSAQNGQRLPVTINGVEQEPFTLTETSLAQPSHFISGENSITIWSPKSLAVRYPGTVTIVTSLPDASVALIDPAGTVWPPTATANGIFNFVVGHRWPSGEYCIRLNADDIRTTVAVENWWPRIFTPPDTIETPLYANFANQVLLLGYSLPQKQVKAGEALPITFYWQAPAEKSPEAEFIQFNHLLDRAGEQWGGYDRHPLENYSTLLWAPGEVVVDGYAVPVEVNAPPGNYYLDVGYYITVGESAVNLPLVVNDRMTDVTSVSVGPIEVISP